MRGDALMARRETGKYPEQIVIMSKKPLAEAVRERSAAEEESISEIGRRWLEIGRRISDVSETSGYPVETIVDQVERTYAGADKA
jgi:hypothetical protein